MSRGGRARYSASNWTTKRIGLSIKSHISKRKIIQTDVFCRPAALYSTTSLSEIARIASIPATVEIEAPRQVWAPRENRLCLVETGENGLVD